MIRLHYSNRIEQLAAVLADALPSPGDVDAMFDGPWLVVPGRPLELYVDLELARRRGISGNIDTLSLGGAFARLCARATPDVMLIQRGHIIGELLAALADDSVADSADLSALRGYLLAAGTGVDAVDRRRVDVARALGALFDDWSSTKPELLAAWRAGDTVAGVDSHPLGRAEHALWNELFGASGRFERRGAAEGKRYLTLAEALSRGLDDAWRPPSAIHLFGLNELPLGLPLALSRLGQRTRVEIYALNPCREFWEDLNTARRPPPSRATHRRRGGTTKRTDSRQLAFAGLTTPTPAEALPATTDMFPNPAGMGEADHPNGAAAVDGDNLFLRAWGHAGRQSTHLLNQLSDGDFDPAYVDPLTDRLLIDSPSADVDGAAGADASVLRRVQRDILDRRPPRRDADAMRLPADASIQLLQAPNPRRELENIAAAIWTMVSAGTPFTLGGAPAPTGPRSPLRFSDIAVAIAGNDEPYLSLARAVFREARDLPHAIVDQPLVWSSHLIEAVLAVLALPLGGFTRREILDVITHPNVRARFPDADPDVWLHLCEGLGIAHGTDRVALENTYIDSDVFNWDQGLKRLALGVFARGIRGGVDDPIHLPPARAYSDAGSVGGAANHDAPANAYVPAEVSSDMRPDADAMALLVRSLLADAAFARRARMTVPAWMRFVRALMAAYVVPLSADDESARLRVFSTLDELTAQYPATMTIGLGTVVQLVQAALTGLHVTRGQMLGAGVVLGTLTSLRSVPFRVIFVVGLDHDRFPTGDHPSPLDVQAVTPSAGDITPRQHQRYLFLEALLAARDALILSHVDREDLTGEPREPSAVLLELCEHLRRGYLDASATMAQRIPLHRDEDPAIHRTFLAAAAEARARDLGVALHRAVPDVGVLDSAAIVRSLHPAARNAVATDLRLIDLSSAAAARTRPRVPARRVLQLADLRRFLECPLQGSARVSLGLRDLPDDTEARQTADEPFDVPRWLERGLLGEVLMTAWADTGTVPDMPTVRAGYDAAIGRARAGRTLPAGLFRANARHRHLRILEQWLESLALAPVPPHGPAQRVCFGRPEPFAAPAIRRAPLTVTVAASDRADTVEIHGTTEPQVLFGTRAGSLVLPTSDNPDHNDKDSLRAFLDHVVLSASRPDGQDATDFAGAICRPEKKTGDGHPPRSVEFPPLATARARAYLTALVGELLGGVHAYLFPCDAVFRSWGDEQKTLVEHIDQTRADTYYRRICSSNWGPVPNALDYPTPSADAAARYEEARFGLLRSGRVAAPDAGKTGKATQAKKKGTS